MAASMTPERLSIMIGVLAVIAATLPRYIVGGDQGRLMLILLGFGAIAIVAAAAWRMLTHEARRRLPGLLGRLMAMLSLGCVVVALWQWFDKGWLAPLLLLSHGVTLGLLLHAIAVGWRRKDA